MFASSRKVARASVSTPSPEERGARRPGGTVVAPPLGAHLRADRDQLGEVGDRLDHVHCSRCERARARTGSRRAGARYRRRPARTGAAGRSGAGSPRRSSPGRAGTPPGEHARTPARAPAARGAQRRLPERALARGARADRVPEVSDRRSRQRPRPYGRRPRRSGRRKEHRFELGRRDVDPALEQVAEERAVALGVGRARIVVVAHGLVAHEQREHRAHALDAAERLSPSSSRSPSRSSSS